MIVTQWGKIRIFLSFRFLREINFGGCKSTKNAVYGILGLLVFELGKSKPSQNADISKEIQNSEPLDVLKLQFLNLKHNQLWFHVKYDW